MLREHQGGSRYDVQISCELRVADNGVDPVADRRAHPAFHRLWSLTDRVERRMSHPEADALQNCDHVAGLVAVVALPEQRLLERLAMDTDRTLFEGAPGLGEGRRHDRERRLAAFPQRPDRFREFRGRLAAQSGVDLLEEADARLVPRLDEQAMLGGRSLRARLSASIATTASSRPSACHVTAA